MGFYVLMDSISLRILAYLADNPEATDTPAGIAQWWLLDGDARAETAEVERALARLAAEGWLLAARATGSPARYRLNPARAADLEALLREERT